LLTLIGTAWFHPDRDWNTTSRLLVTHALVEFRSIEITPYVTRDGELLRNPPTWDLASPDGRRYYGDKAPGASFLAAPGFTFLRSLGLARDHPRGEPGFARRAEDYRITLLSSGLTAALGAALVTLALSRSGVGSRAAALAGLTLGLGTPWLVYGTLLYGHGPAGVIALAAITVWSLDSQRLRSGVLTGSLLGLAVVTEYPLAILVVLVGAAHAAAALFRPSTWTWRWFAGMIAGGLPLAVLLGAYHVAVTGSPWRAPYTVEVRQDLFGYHAEGMGLAVGRPTLEALFGLTLGSERGLLPFIPAAALAPLGFIRLLRERRVPEAVVLAGFPVLMILLHAGFPNWHGGLATGPRFLVPTFPILIFLAGLGIGARHRAEPSATSDSGAAPARSVSATGLARTGWLLLWIALAGYGTWRMATFAQAGGRFNYPLSATSPRELNRPNSNASVTPLAEAEWLIAAGSRAWNLGDQLALRLDWQDRRGATGLLLTRLGLLSLIALAVVLAGRD
jgi:hypothetical protein